MGDRRRLPKRWADDAEDSRVDAEWVVKRRCGSGCPRRKLGQMFDLNPYDSVPPPVGPVGRKMLAAAFCEVTRRVQGPAHGRATVRPRRADYRCR